MELWAIWLELGILVLAGVGLLLAARRLGQIPGPPQKTFQNVTRLLGVVLLCIAIWSSFTSLDRQYYESFTSPDGQILARRIVGLGGWMYPKKTKVFLRKRGQVFATEVYSGDGWAAGGGEASPYVHWTDDTHLILDYHSATKPSLCLKRAGQIEIECREQTW